MFLARNKMILGTGSSITFRSLLHTRYLIASGFAGESRVIGEDIELSLNETDWFPELFYDFGEESELTEFGFWIRAANESNVGKVTVEPLIN